MHSFFEDVLQSLGPEAGVTHLGVSKLFVSELFVLNDTVHPWSPSLLSLVAKGQVSAVC